MTGPALAPDWALGALAMHAIDDPHIVDGFHYRLITDPRLGLPMRPVDVWYADLGVDAKNAVPRFSGFPPLRKDITWTDSRGKVLVAPFRVTPDNPVTGVLPGNGIARCGWLKVETTQTSQIRADAFRSTTRGPRTLVSRDQAPLSLAASNIHGVVVSGSGVVQDLTWLDVWRLQGGDNHSQMGLPRKVGARYLDPAPGSPLFRATLRVRRGAPKRLGLHDDPSASDPWSAAAATPFADVAKAGSQATLITEAFNAVLDDETAPQHLLERSEELEAEGTKQPLATWRPIDLIHQAMHDQSMARFLGFMDAEPPDEFDLDPDHVVLYQLRSWWAIDPAALSPAELVSFLASLEGYLSPGTDDGPDGPLWSDSPDGLPIFHLWVPALLVVGRPPLRPDPPVVGPELRPSPNTPDGLGPWLPAIPPEARRQATVSLSGLVPLAGLAAATEADGVVTGMNERIDVRLGAHDDRALLHVPSIPADAADPASRTLSHRNVPPEGFEFRVAQADAFGRWSDWGFYQVPQKSRPRPPDAVFDLWYAMSEDDGPGPQWGRLQARVQVPPIESLAPGSFPLERVRVEGDVDGFAFDVLADLTDPAAKELEIEIARPSEALLDVGRSAVATATARWLDSAGGRSRRSTPRVTTCTDRRQPDVLPPPPPVLDWTARPDATGRARVRLTWSPGGDQQRFRVFGSDEQRLRSQAEARNEPPDVTFVTALDEATGKPARAQVLRDHYDIFDSDWFTNLTEKAVEIDGGGGDQSFQHELSGSLGVLAVYKIVGETEAGTPADFATSPLHVWAVPERSGPPQPLLEVLGIEAGPPVAANLRLRLTGDETAAVRYRLRRSVIHSDARRMPVAQEGAIMLEPEQKFADLTDLGAFVHDDAHRLEPGRPYTWRVEVQADDLPGSAVPGPWSRPSVAVSTRLIEEA